MATLDYSLKKFVFIRINCFDAFVVRLISMLAISVFAVTTNAAIMDLPSSPEQIHPLLVGTQIPDAQVRRKDGTITSLKTEVSNHPTVLVFYRGGWCPYCNLQLGKLKQIEGDLIRLGYQIVAISADRPEELIKSGQKQVLSYTLLSDSSLNAAKAFGIAYRLDDANFKKYQGLGIDIESASGEKHHLLPVPGVFLVGPDGKIQFEYVNPDYKQRLEAEILLSAACVFSPKKSMSKNLNCRSNK